MYSLTRIVRNLAPEISPGPQRQGQEALCVLCKEKGGEEVEKAEEEDNGVCRQNRNQKPQRCLVRGQGLVDPAKNWCRKGSENR